jgi:hypothetical protein
MTIFHCLKFDISLSLEFGTELVKVMLRSTASRPISHRIKNPPGGYDQISVSVTLAGLLMWGALSDWRTGLSFTIAAGPRQRSHFRVRVSCNTWPYFTVSDSRLPFLSPTMTRRVTVEVFESASKLVSQNSDKVKVKVMLRPTASRPVCLGMKHPCVA